MYSVVCFVFSLLLPEVARRLGRKMTHVLCLLCGAAGLLIVASLAFGWVMLHLLHNNRLAAVVAGGGFLILAAALMPRVKEVATP